MMKKMVLVLFERWWKLFNYAFAENAKSSLTDDEKDGIDHAFFQNANGSLWKMMKVVYCAFAENAKSFLTDDETSWGWAVPSSVKV